MNTYNWGVPAYELRAMLSLLTLSVDNTVEYWEDKLEFIGTDQQRKSAELLAIELSESI